MARYNVFIDAEVHNEVCLICVKRNFFLLQPLFHCFILLEYKQLNHAGNRNISDHISYYILFLESFHLKQNGKTYVLIFKVIDFEEENLM